MHERGGMESAKTGGFGNPTAKATRLDEQFDMI